MHIDIKELKHLAKLAKLNYPDKELEEMGPQFGEILEFVSKLNKLDTEGIEPMYHPIENVFMQTKSGISEENNEKDLLLKNTPHKIEDGKIVIKSSTVEH